MADYKGQYTGPEIDRLIGRIDGMADTAERVADDTARTVAREVGAAAAKTKINEYIPQLDGRVSAAQTAQTGAETAKTGAETAKTGANAIKSETQAIKNEVEQTANNLMYSLLHVQKAPPMQYLDEAIVLVSPTMAML